MLSYFPMTQTTSKDRLSEWANGLINQPIGVDDDYGNLILSVGLAHQQKLEATQGPSEVQQDHALCDDSMYNTAKETRSRPGVIASQESTHLNTTNIGDSS